MWRCILSVFVLTARCDFAMSRMNAALSSERDALMPAIFAMLILPSDPGASRFRSVAVRWPNQSLARRREDRQAQNI